jgi:hypothetical protein
MKAIGSSYPQVVTIALTAIILPLLLSFLAGNSFGTWPFIFKHTKLDRFSALAAFCLFQSAILILVGFFYRWYQDGEISTGRVVASVILVTYINIYCKYMWGLTGFSMRSPVLLASLVSSFGLICLAMMMPLTTPATLGICLATMTATSIMVTGGIDIWINREQIRPSLVFGYLMIIAGVVTIVLSTKRVDS